MIEMLELWESGDRRGCWLCTDCWSRGCRL